MRQERRILFHLVRLSPWEREKEENRFYQSESDSPVKRFPECCTSSLRYTHAQQENGDKDVEIEE